VFQAGQCLHFGLEDLLPLLRRVVLAFGQVHAVLDGPQTTGGQIDRLGDGPASSLAKALVFVYLPQWLAIQVSENVKSVLSPLLICC